ncbi:hypothetical protein [Synechococcus sp. CBW1108]|uniref:hypothetical protein n=1 Tax=Synechococcus sp. CBW1108 TaxID=1353147 RepID=UPI0018CF83A2|nr:hypothetical protein [Synechococcus sp. CBW1108]QPN69813.1 hypothetical protein H8F27_15275 [Synechococcus sp. CBW1108]
MRLIPPIVLTAVLAVVAGSSSAEAGCRFLMPLGGGGEPVVAKRIGPDRLLGSTNPPVSGKMSPL